jgi:hypothetical protein
MSDAVHRSLSTRDCIIYLLTNVLMIIVSLLVYLSNPDVNGIVTLTALSLMMSASLPLHLSRRDKSNVRESVAHPGTALHSVIGKNCGHVFCLNGLLTYLLHVIYSLDLKEINEQTCCTASLK